MDINQLSEATGVTVRTIREYVSRGLLRRPMGKTRNSYYTNEHESELMAIRSLLVMDKSLERAAVAMQARRLEKQHAAEAGRVAGQPQLPSGDAGRIGPMQSITISDGLMVVFREMLYLDDEERREFSTQVLNCYTRLARKSRMNMRALGEAPEPSSMARGVGAF